MPRVRGAGAPSEVSESRAKASSMLVEHLYLDGIKCFAPRTKIDFDAGKAAPHRWVVIYGNNGLGKSTLLRAIGMALTGQPALNALLPNADGWVHEKQREAIVKVGVTKGVGDRSPGAPRVRTLTLMWSLIGKA